MVKMNKTQARKAKHQKERVVEIPDSLTAWLLTVIVESFRHPFKTTIIRTKSKKAA